MKSANYDRILLLEFLLQNLAAVLKFGKFLILTMSVLGIALLKTEAVTNTDRGSRHIPHNDYLKNISVIKGDPLQRLIFFYLPCTSPLKHQYNSTIDS